MCRASGSVHVAATAAAVRNRIAMKSVELKGNPKGKAELAFALFSSFFFTLFFVDFFCSDHRMVHPLLQRAAGCRADGSWKGC